MTAWFNFSTEKIHEGDSGDSGGGGGGGDNGGGDGIGGDGDGGGSGDGDGDIVFLPSGGPVEGEEDKLNDLTRRFVKEVMGVRDQLLIDKRWEKQQLDPGPSLLK